ARLAGGLAGRVPGGVLGLPGGLARLPRHLARLGAGARDRLRSRGGERVLGAPVRLVGGAVVRAVCGDVVRAVSGRLVRAVPGACVRPVCRRGAGPGGGLSGVAWVGRRARLRSGGRLRSRGGLGTRVTVWSRAGVGRRSRLALPVEVLGLEGFVERRVEGGVVEVVVGNASPRTGPCRPGGSRGGEALAGRVHLAQDRDELLGLLGRDAALRGHLPDPVDVAQLVLLTAG